MPSRTPTPPGTIEDMVFCPYLGRDIPVSSSSFEHVIPLSLGGADGFGIRVDRQTNSKLGHAIDGALANDPIIAMQRARRDCRGHSNKPVTAIWKNTQDAQGRPLQAIIGQSTLNYFDPRLRRILTEEETAGQSFMTTWKFGLLSKVPFSAKVALGTGHFAFGSQFEAICRCADFRQLLTPTHDIPDKLLRRNRVTYFDPINDLKNDRKDPRHLVLEQLVKLCGCSMVIITSGRGQILFSIGILGEWLSTMTAPANEELIPYDGEFDLGHVILMKNRKVFRMSFRAAISDLAGALNIPIPTALPSVSTEI